MQVAIDVHHIDAVLTHDAIRSYVLVVAVIMVSMSSLMVAVVAAAGVTRMTRMMMMIDVTADADVYAAY
jgi:hypothetical protein